MVREAQGYRARCALVDTLARLPDQGPGVACLEDGGASARLSGKEEEARRPPVLASLRRKPFATGARDRLAGAPCARGPAADSVLLPLPLSGDAGASVAGTISASLELDTRLPR